MFEKVKNLFASEKKDIGSSRELSETYGFILGGEESEFSPRNYKTFAKRAYIANVIAHRCIDERATAMGTLNWQVFDGDKEVDDNHPYARLLARPNPTQGTSAFFSEIEYYMLISGNNYMVPNNAQFDPNVTMQSNGVPTELFNLRPDRVVVGASDLNMVPIRYTYMPRGIGNHDSEVVYPVDQITGQANVLHTMFFNPLNRFVGLSPIEAALTAVETHNTAVTWNYSLLKNGARPSFVITVKGKTTKDQKEQLRQRIDDVFAGGNNSGRPMVLGDDMEAKELGLSPKDMDYANTKASFAKDIATAFRVPPILINVGSDSTFANMKEARLSMWEDTIIPQADLIRDELNNWLSPQFGDNIRLDYDKNAIDALIERRQQKSDALEKVSYMTVNEKREASGLEPIDGGDVLPTVKPTVTVNGAE